MVLGTLAVARSCGPATRRVGRERWGIAGTHLSSVLHTDPPLLGMSSYRHGSEWNTATHRTWKITHPWLSLHLGLLPPRTLGGSAFLIPLASGLPETSGTPVPSRRFSHAEKSVCQCRYLLTGIALHTLVSREGITLGFSRYHFKKILGTFHKAMIP